jgi:hypothetical protein
MKLLAIAALATCCTATLAAAPQPKDVDFNTPGALSAIQRDDPARFAQIERIIDEVQDQPPAQVSKWLKTEFDARLDSYADFVLTSLPPKKRLAFELGDTRYHGLVTLTREGPHLYLAR